MTCLIGRPDNSGYCGKPATTKWGKLPACDDCADELNLQISLKAKHRIAPSESGA